MLAIDTETTGLDLHHGARPYFVTTCDHEGVQRWWEWSVDPLTRKPSIPSSDVQEIQEFFEKELDRPDGHFVFQNGKFDVLALRTIELPMAESWPWDRTSDTLLSGHLLASNQPHNLTDMVLQYLGEDIQPIDDELEKVVKECRRLVQRARLKIKGRKKKAAATKSEIPLLVVAEEDPYNLDRQLVLADYLEESGQIQAAKDLRNPGPLEEQIAYWRIAEDGLSEMPSVKSSGGGKEKERFWKADAWLPRAIADHFKYAKDHPYRKAVVDYANADSSTTLLLWRAMEKIIKSRKFDKIFRERMKVLAVCVDVEWRGVTLNRNRLEELVSDYQAESEKLGAEMKEIAKRKGFDLELPKNGINKSLRTCCFDVLKLPPVHNPKAKTDAPAIDSKNAIPYWIATLPDGDEKRFVECLEAKRDRDTSLSYLASYTRLWSPLHYSRLGNGEAGIWFVLHPNLNPCGTDTLRCSSNNPNGQNIKKEKDAKGRTLRDCFCPGPGRELWSLDAKNIERRIPAYHVNEEAIVNLFEKPDEPPYYGSEHLLVAHVLFPKEFEECRGKDGQLDGRIFKDRYNATLYKRVKCGNFAVQYGAMNRPDGWGTADRTYGIRFAHSKIEKRFSKQDELNKRLIRQAERLGYIETIPDKSVDPERGYPLLCARTAFGGVLPTTPFNYWGQGTAGWWMMKAMIRCHGQLVEWTADDPRGYYIALQVHDELVFDFPAGRGKEPWKTNLPKIRRIKQLMEQGGEDLGIPTPVSVEYNQVSWGHGITIAV